jgi:transposase
MDLRRRIINAVEEGGSMRKVAQRFAVGKNLVQKLVTQLQAKGHIQPEKQGGSAVSPVWQYKDQLLRIFEKKTDATLKEYCELLADETGLWVSQSTMCRTFQKLNLPLKKSGCATVGFPDHVGAPSKRSVVAKPRVNESKY